jgi:hypothetical protein
MTEKFNTKFVTPEIVCSYPALFEAEDPFNSGQPKYSLSIPISKDDKESLSQIQQCMINAAVNKWGEKAKSLKGLALPLTDSDTSNRDEDPVYANTYYFNAKSNKRPGVVDQALKPVMDEEEVYPGCIVRASMSFYGYDFNNKKGIAVGLQNVMKVRDGERIGGGSRAEDDFSEFATTQSSNADAGNVDIFNQETPF